MPNLLESLDKTHWRTFRFDEIARNISERVEPGATDLAVYVGLEHIDSGSLHIKRTGVPSDVEGTKLRVYAGDVIFGRRRAYQRKAAVATFDGICSAHALVLRAKPEVIDPRLFPFFLHSDVFMHRAVDISVGGLSPTINWGNLKLEKFLLPPLDQQARLAELLWAADDMSEEYKSLVAIQKHLLELLRDVLIFSNSNSPLINEPRKNGVSSNAWHTQKISDAVEIASGQVNPTQDAYKDLIQIGAEHIEGGTGKIISKQTAQELNLISGKYQFDESHVLYSKIRPYLRKVANPDFAGLCSADMYPMRGRGGKIEKNFLFHFLLSKRFTEQIMKHQVRTGMPKVNRDELGSVLIPIPPKETQRSIVARLEAIQLQLDKTSSVLEAAVNVKSQLISRIFSA